MAKPIKSELTLNFGLKIFRKKMLKYMTQNGSISLKKTLNILNKL